MSESERGTTALPQNQYIVKVSQGVRETVLDGCERISDLPYESLREAWLVLNAYAADVRGEMTKRGHEGLEARP